MSRSLKQNCTKIIKFINFINQFLINFIIQISNIKKFFMTIKKLNIKKKCNKFEYQKVKSIYNLLITNIIFQPFNDFNI